MKILFIMLFAVSAQIVDAQIVLTKNNVDEYDFFYSDSVNNEFAYGNYEPNAIVCLDDGSLIIGTKFSIDFPSAYEPTDTYDSIYCARLRAFLAKTHVSSGSVFKLNKNFEKEWETFFREQRVQKILKTTDGRILVFGEDVSMKFVWMSEIDTNGKVLWERRYRYQNRVRLGDAVVDQDNSIYLLLEASHIIPIQIQKNHRRRVQFFRDSEMNTHLGILKLSSKGERKWFRSIDSRVKYSKFWYDLIIGPNLVFASYTFDDLKGVQRDIASRVVEMSSQGRVLSKATTAGQGINDLLFWDQGLVEVSSQSEEGLVVYHSKVEKDSIPIKTSSQVTVAGCVRTSDGCKIFGSISGDNLDYFVVDLDRNLKFSNCQTYYKDQYNEARGAVVLADGSVVIVGQCYKEMNDGKSIKYLNLVVIKK